MTGIPRQTRRGEFLTSLLMMHIKIAIVSAILLTSLTLTYSETFANQSSPQDIFSRVHSSSEKTRELSRNSATRDEAITILGYPDYVILPKDFKKMGYEGSRDLAYALLWENAPCTSNELWFDKHHKIIGANVMGGWNATASNLERQCPESTLSIERDELKKFSCKRNTRPAQCIPAGKPTPPSLSREERRKIFEAQFSSWDGSNKILEKEIKSRMYNPSSYKHLESRHRYENNNVIAITTFTGTNALGALVTNTAFATIDINGTILRMEMQK